MRNLVLATTVLVLLAGGYPSQGQSRPQNRQCLHDQLETRTERVRREKALSVADAINRAQAAARRFGARQGGTCPLRNCSMCPRYRKASVCSSTRTGFDLRVFDQGHDETPASTRCSPTRVWTYTKPCRLPRGGTTASDQEIGSTMPRRLRDNTTAVRYLPFASRV